MTKEERETVAALINAGRRLLTCGLEDATEESRKLSDAHQAARLLLRADPEPDPRDEDARFLLRVLMARLGLKRVEVSGHEVDDAAIGENDTDLVIKTTPASEAWTSPVIATLELVPKAGAQWPAPTPSRGPVQP